MISATGLLIEFAHFLQIISFIIIPVLVIVIAITIIRHYRHKKRKAKAEDTEDNDEVLSVDDPLDIPNGKPAYLLFDHSGLYVQYRNKLSYNHARYAALRQDFRKTRIEIRRRTTTFQIPHSITQNPKKKENTPAQWNATIQKMAEKEHVDERKRIIEPAGTT